MSSPPPTPSSDDLAWVRAQTNGATEYDDSQLTAVMEQWTCTDDDDGTVTLDRWAAAAMVLEGRLLAALQVPTTGVQQARSGDAVIEYHETGGSTWLLRTYIKRYWRQACPANRALMHPSGWRTLSVHSARRHALLLWPHSGIAINGPGFGIDSH